MGISDSKYKYLNIFPDEFIQLNEEIARHPRLQKLLANHPAGEWEIRLAEIANYCEVILDGDYLPEDIIKICKLLNNRLILMREDNRSVLVLS